MDAELLRIFQTLDAPYLQSDHRARMNLARRALSLLAREDHPPAWALLQNTLGTAAAQLAQENEGKPAEAAMMEQAVAAFEQASQVGPPLLPLEYWHTAQRNLAMGYAARLLGDREANLAQACAAFRTLLRTLTRRQSPLAWADIMMRLGTVYLDRFAEDRAANLDQAVQCYQQALEVFRPQQNPVEWSLLWNNLGNIYVIQSHGLGQGALGLAGRADLVDQGIAAFKQALQVRTRAAMPFEWAQTTMNLASAYRNLALSGRDPELIERVLGMYKQVLEVLNRDASPGDWAKAQANLAAMYHERIYGERSDNMEQAIKACRLALSIMRPIVDPSEWITTQITLGDAYKSRMVGERAENLEAAIAAYEQVLQVINPAHMPADWVVLINNLGTAYMDRIHGNRADNLERALELFNQALPFISRISHPDEWAMLLVNLGTAYFKRSHGDHAKNIESALDYYEQALQERNAKISPIEYASALTNLGMIYIERPMGNRSANIERAIELLELALPIQTRETLPYERANTLLNLATAYLVRAEGNRADNIETTLALLGETLEIRTRDKVPMAWADAQMNLATAYHLRVQGDRTANQEESIAAYKQALTVRTRDKLPREWAEVQLNLSNAYGERILGDRAANAELSLQAAQAALTVLTYEETPREWADAWQNLGNAYTERRSASRAVDLRAAHAAYEEALRVYSRASDPNKWAGLMSNIAVLQGQLPATAPQDRQGVVDILQQVLQVETREADPLRWAMTMHNLGNAYAQQARAGTADIAQAIDAYRQALQVRALETLPEEHRKTQQVLGNLCFARQNWAEAAIAFGGALAAGDVLYLASATPAARQAELSETAELPGKAAYSLARLGRFAEAISTLEQGRARALSEALARHEVALQQATAEDRAAFIAGQKQIVALEAEARAPDEQPKKRDFLAISAELRAARDGLAAIVRRIQSYVPQFLPARWQFADISRAVTTAVQPLVYLFTTEAGSAALLVAPGQDAPDARNVVWLDGVKLDDLHRVLFKAWPPQDDQHGYLYATVTGDNAVLQSELNELARGFVPTFMAAVTARLSKWGYREAWLVAAGNLALLPLHSLGDNTICWSLIPSARALQTAQQAVRNRSAPLLLGIGNPLPSAQPLVAARIEVEEIARLFPAAAVRTLYETKATRAAVLDALPGATYLHFSCHGLFDWRQPLESLLALAGDDRLTLRDLLDGAGDLSATQLVVLSACQTGIIDFSDVPDEVIGFPAAFLQAGVPGVISTLWPVPDLPTALLLIRCYRHLRLDNLAPATALRQSQQWLRTATAQELKLDEYWMRIASRTWDEEQRKQAFGSAQACRQNPDQRPFEQPFYWGAFTFSGYASAATPAT